MTDGGGGRRVPASAGSGRVLALGLLLGACELTDVDLTEIEDVVVAEALVLVPDSGGASPGIARVMLHRTLGEDGTSQPVPGATVRILGTGDEVLDLERADPGECATIVPESGGGTCYVVRDFEEPIRPGDALELAIELPDGGRLASATRVPRPFQLSNVESRAACRIPPDENLELVWSRSEGAWAYVTETAIFGLDEALEPRGIEVEEDPLVLVGLSVSESDTTLVLPSQLGLFDRTELDRDVALVLQEGLPAGTQASVSVAAVDRNYVNWARGGNFNPSGPVRVPSVVGDGTGFFGSAVLRTFVAVASEDVPGAPPRCGTHSGG